MEYLCWTIPGGHPGTRYGGWRRQARGIPSAQASADRQRLLSTSSLEQIEVYARRKDMIAEKRKAAMICRAKSLY
jgi:hypothetical protein